MPVPDPFTNPFKGITGICPCCGVPFIKGVLRHDPECVYYPYARQPNHPDAAKEAVMSAWVDPSEVDDEI